MTLTRGQKKFLGLLAVGGAVAGGAYVISKQSGASTKFTYGGYNPPKIDFQPPYPALTWPRDRKRIVNEYISYGVVTFMYGNIDPAGDWQFVGSDVVQELRTEGQKAPVQNARSRAGILGWFVPQKGWITVDDRSLIGPLYG